MPCAAVPCQTLYGVRNMHFSRNLSCPPALRKEARMLKFGIAAALAISLVTPARAAIFLISGTATGTSLYVYPCTITAYCVETTPLVHEFSFMTEASSDDFGLYQFSYGFPYSAAYYGSFRETQPGEFSGVRLDYVSVSGHFPPLTENRASTGSFSVLQTSPPPVPEPSTWLSMLLGIAGVALALRKRGGVLAGLGAGGR